MKKAFCLLLVLCVVISTVPTLAEDSEEKTIPDTWQIVYDWRNKTSLFWAEINGETCTIKAVAQYQNDELVVPYKEALCVKEHPSYTFGEPITVSTLLIDKDALKKGADEVRTITFAEGHEILPDGLCEGMYNLKTVNLPESVYAIGNNCFKNCENLENINLENVQYIGTDAFTGTKIDIDNEEESNSANADDSYIYLAKETIVDQANIVEMSVKALSQYKVEDSKRYDFTTTDPEKIKAVLGIVNECRYTETKGVLMSESPTFLITFTYSDGKEISESFRESTIRVGDKKYQLNEDDYWRLEECIEGIKKDIEAESIFSDIEKSDAYYDATKALSQLGIMAGYDDKTFRPDTTLSRAEAAAMIVRLLNLEINPAGGETSFSDVPTSHWASGYISWATENGIINGQGDGTFAPEEFVTKHQLIKMLVCTLGYEPMAMANGGWNYGGYITAAEEIGLIEKDNLNKNVHIKRGEAALICYRALDIDFMEWVETTSGIYGQLYRICENETILTEYWDYEKIECVIKESGGNLLIKVIKNYADEPYYKVGQVFTLEDENLRELADSIVNVYMKKTPDAKNEILLLK